MERGEADGASAGMALVAALLGIVFLAALGIVLVLTTSAETRIAASYQTAQQGLYAANAIAERAMRDLAPVTDWNTVLNGSVVSSFTDGGPAGIRRLTDGASIDLSQVINAANCQKSTTCTTSEMNAVTDDRPWGTNNPRWRLFAYGPFGAMLPADSPGTNWYVVAMTGDDPGEADNDPTRDGPSGSPGAGIAALRAEAFGAGGAHKVIECTVASGSGGVRLLTWRELR